jgi:hypothetical protein
MQCKNRPFDATLLYYTDLLRKVTIAIQHIISFEKALNFDSTSFSLRRVSIIIILSNKTSGAQKSQLSASLETIKCSDFGSDYALKP